MGVNIKTSRPPLKESSTIPMEREVAKLMSDFTGRNIQNRPVVTTDTESIITIQEEANKFEYHIDTMSLDEIKKILSIPQEEGAINFGKQFGRMLLTLQVLAFEQYKGNGKLEGEFKMSEITKLWKVSDGTKTRRAIKDLLSSLYSSSFVKTQQIGPAEKEFTIARFVTTISRHEKEGEEVIYRFTLNEPTLGRAADWIKTGKISKSWQQEGYLGVPKKDIVEKNHDVHYLNFRERLRLLGGSRHSSVVKTKIKAETLLRDWFKFAPRSLNRRTLCRDVILRSLELAKQEQELLDYTYNLPENVHWKKEWYIEIKKANR